MKIQTGLQMDRDYLLNRLVEIGYQRVSMIEAKGQCSVRGEIIDIFPPEREQPVRVEMFEDNIAAMRTFDCQTQRSTGDLTGIDVNPAFELILTPDKFREGGSALRRETKLAMEKLVAGNHVEAARALGEKVERHLVRLAEPGAWSCTLLFFLFYGQGASVLQYLKRNSLILLDEPDQLIDQGHG